MVESQDVGLRFSKWPLHVTLLPWFAAPNIEKVMALCEKTAGECESFSVSVKERAYLGPNNKLAVMLLDKNAKIMGLHQKLLSKVASKDWSLQGRWTGAQYRPHVTRHGGKDAEGEVTINALYIVERLGQGYRKVVGKVLIA